MKTFEKLAVSLILLSGTAFFVSGQTLKERIDFASEIRVYFRNSDIEHNPNTQGNPELAKQGTNCEKFRETTSLPSEYIDAVKQITGMLNKGFNTTVFKEGDLTYLSSLPVDSKGELDWLRLGEHLTFFVSTHGTYSVNKFPNTGKENTMEIQSRLYVYSVSDGKLKTLSSTLLAWKQTQPIKTQDCNNYDWFVRNIPANSLAEPFKELVTENILKFINKELSAYEKAMKKKK